jgi:hypothetical protein
MKKEFIFPKKARDLEDLIQAGKTEPQDWEHVSLLHATQAMDDAQGILRRVKDPEAKVRAGKILNLAMRIRARRWSEKPTKKFEDHIAQIRAKVAAAIGMSAIQEPYLDKLLAEKTRLEEESSPRLYRRRDAGSLSLIPKRGYEALHTDDILDGSVEIHIFPTRESLLAFLSKTGDNTPGLININTSVTPEGKLAVILTKEFDADPKAPAISITLHQV